MFPKQMGAFGGLEIKGHFWRKKRQEKEASKENISGVGEKQKVENHKSNPLLFKNFIFFDCGKQLG